jgi:hypothetical protein
MQSNMSPRYKSTQRTHLNEFTLDIFLRFERSLLLVLVVSVRLRARTCCYNRLCLGFENLAALSQSFARVGVYDRPSCTLVENRFLQNS